MLRLICFSRFFNPPIPPELVVKLLLCLYVASVCFCRLKDPHPQHLVITPR